MTSMFERIAVSFALVWLVLVALPYVTVAKNPNPLLAFLPPMVCVVSIGLKAVWSKHG